MDHSSKLDPLQIFRQGHALCEAFKRLSKAAATDAQIIPVSTPAMVMSAFSSELFLKCLICLDTGNVTSLESCLIGFPKRTRIGSRNCGT